MAEVKERLTEQQINRTTEAVPQIIDVQKRREEDALPPGVETWMQRVEKAVPQNSVNDSRTGAPILQPTTVQSSTKTTPATRKTFARGFRMAVNEANRWLSEFIFRFIKMNGGNVQFKKEEITS